MAHDLVYAFRILRKSPIATAVTILALALGIGANIGSFIAVNAIVLHPFAYPDLERILTVWGTQPKSGLDRAGVTAADFEDWRQQTQSFEALSVYDNWAVNLTGADRPEPVQGARVGAAFFQVFGMKPSIGRTFAQGEGESGNARVAAEQRIVAHAIRRGGRYRRQDDFARGAELYGGGGYAGGFRFSSCYGGLGSLHFYSGAKGRPRLA
jgi:hypothetical protein